MCFRVVCLCTRCSQFTDLFSGHGSARNQSGIQRVQRFRTWSTDAQLQMMIFYIEYKYFTTTQWRRGVLHIKEPLVTSALDQIRPLVLEDFVAFNDANKGCALLCLHQSIASFFVGLFLPEALPEGSQALGSDMVATATVAT